MSYPTADDITGYLSCIRSSSGTAGVTDITDLTPYAKTTDLAPYAKISDIDIASVQDRPLFCYNDKHDKHNDGVARCYHSMQPSLSSVSKDDSRLSHCSMLAETYHCHSDPSVRLMSMLAPT